MAKYNEIGKSGLSEWSGYIQEEFLTELRGSEGRKRYKEMSLNSPVIGALMTAIEMSVRAVDFQWASDIEEGQPDPGLELLNYCTDEAMSHTLEEHIVEVLTMLVYGWSMFETVYQSVPDYAAPVWRKFAIRGQNTLNRWLFDDNGGLAGMEQQLDKSPWRVELPIEKCLLYRTRSEKGNPEGRSILRNSWIPYYYGKHLQQIEAIGMERDLTGLPSVTLPEGADARPGSDDYKAADGLVSRVRNDQSGGVVLPYGWEFALVSSPGSRSLDIGAAIQRHESRMLLSTLAQFLLLGQDRVGALATFEGGVDFFTMSINAIADIISETITKYAVPRLFKLHGIEVEGHRLDHPPVGETDIVAVADFLAKVGAKVTWTTEDELWLRSVARLPEMDAEALDAAKEEAKEIGRASCRERV